VVRLYGLRMWVEQRYKQTKDALGRRHYQVRSDRAMRRHWQLVCCAFSFCWWHDSPRPPAVAAPPDVAHESRPAAEEAAGRGGIRAMRPQVCWPVALRGVRAWPAPWIMLRRSWRSWSPLPPPAALRGLLEHLRHGHGLDLYASP
jgi:hypothetical protein